MVLDRPLAKLSSLAGLATIAFATVASAADSGHSFSGKAALYSEYEYRGLAQTSEDPALQLTLDYAHASGFYAGTFLSNVKWLEDTGEVLGKPTDAKVEWDFYGGYRRSLAPGWTADLGVHRYQYPSTPSFEPNLGSPNTTEVYAGLGWGPATLRYSYALTQLFGVPDSEGSDYLELSVNHPVTAKLTLNGVVGHQRYRGSQPAAGQQFDNGNFDYTVWKLGATYDFGSGFTAGAYYKGTDANPLYFTFNGMDWSDDRLVAFVAYSF
ncbi:MAG: hypothetical protein IPP91_02315 [Betaproteobacteria bacterium]|nr:hypothetical protein [Betaproteobacteria bacterium]